MWEVKNHSINRIMSFIKRIFYKNSFKTYSIGDVFGCPECPPQNCPTFIERDVHKKFKDAIINNNIIVVYGESRQGKTWTIERYCQNQLRIGCTASKDVAQLKRDMLDVLGIKIRQVKHSITTEVKTGLNSSSKIGSELALAAGTDASLSTGQSETIDTEYLTIDLDNDTEFLHAIKQHSQGKFYVFDNFHYLPPVEQKSFCSLLKEFNYHGIKIIIVGVWKDASRITAMAPDLVNRCEHIDIGSWKDSELNKKTQKGEQALNISIDKDAQDRFKSCCANNIGIFKTFLLKLVQSYGIYETQRTKVLLDNQEKLNLVMEDAIQEVYAPLSDRIKNLALPQRHRKESKRLRMKIVVSILELIRDLDVNKTQTGIPFESIRQGVDRFCARVGDNQIDVSNIAQELGVLHEREENRQAGANFIPLFYYDKSNRKLLVIEPTLYEIRAYNTNLINSLIATVLEAEQEYHK